MRQTRIIMGMPIIVEIADDISESVLNEAIKEIFAYFEKVDKKFSTYKNDSEISFINNKNLPREKWSAEMKEIFDKAEMTKKETNGYFDIKRENGIFDPSGIVKGWAILNAANMLAEKKFKDFYVDAGGDVEARGGKNGKKWKIGVQNPFNPMEVVKIIYASNIGVATSGTYVRGEHIYNPRNAYQAAREILSLTVIGPDVYEADRFATAAFAMGKEGVNFIERLEGFEAYSIDKNGIGTMTSQFEKYTYA